MKNEDASNGVIAVLVIAVLICSFGWLSASNNASDAGYAAEVIKSRDEQINALMSAFKGMSDKGTTLINNADNECTYLDDNFSSSVGTACDHAIHDGGIGGIHSTDFEDNITSNVQASLKQYPYPKDTDSSQN